MEKLAIIIPAYNEEKRIGKTLERYCKFFNRLKLESNLEYEIIVVLNACKDKTLEVVKKYQREFKEITYLNFKRGGKGFAVIEGFKDALKRENNFIGFVDADLATKPESFYDLFKKIEKNSGIIASRWNKKSVVIEKKSFIRKIYSWGFNFLVRSILLLNYSDTQCGAKLFKREAVEKVVNDLGITDWAFDIDLLYKMKRKNLKVIEIPTMWEDKAGSKVNLIAPLKMFSAIIRLRIIYSPFNFIISAYDKLPEKIKFHNWK